KLVGLDPGVFFDFTFFCWIGGEVAVQGPFGHVAMHIVKSPRVGFFCAYFLVSPIAVFKIPSILSQYCRVVSKRIGGGGAGPAGIFPLCLSRQPIKIPRQGSKPLTITQSCIL